MNSATAGRYPARLMLASLLLLAMAACQSEAPGANQATEAAELALGENQVAVTVETANGPKRFRVEAARTAAEQARGLKYMPELAEDGGMLFHPYPADGTGAAPASFWMKDTATSLDLIFIRADGTIARIAENTVPYSETKIESGEPVAAVLELKGGKTAESGIAEGDRVRWEGSPGT